MEEEQFDIDPYVTIILGSAQVIARFHDNEYVQPEHILSAVFSRVENAQVFKGVFDMKKANKELENYINKNIEKIEFQPTKGENEISSFIAKLAQDTPYSEQTNEVIKIAGQQAKYSKQSQIDFPHLIHAIFLLEDSFSSYILHKYLTTDYGNFLSRLIAESKNQNNAANEIFNILQIGPDDLPEEDTEDAKSSLDKSWKDQISCISDHLKGRNPLIGREAELERTIQILCRKDKNNPLHVGEPGVGKTALVYGLAERINKGKVPEKLKGFKIYEMNIGGLVAGTQYRGDFEKRLKSILDALQNDGKAIVYIDEIHNLVGAGKGGDGSLDACNILKPYLEIGTLRFIGSTTYDEYNRYFSKDKGLVRRFQQIDINEPTVEETILILKQLKSRYEKFHQVKYKADAIEYAVRASAEFITDRFLPDKAIDLIDEAGAYAETHKDEYTDVPVIDKAMITTLLQKVCKINAEVLKQQDDSSEVLKNLEKDIRDNIYGQDKAVNQVVETVQMAKAGLTDETKPLANLLFVGPTGVGKTELCKVLAEKLGIPLVRFDMSEFAEKHTVAKLIGSPAGYVGYEDGGLLTDAIIKTPNCVLLLDEIEKAHPDIFNILLQVMDYARLTDNKGKKADFRHVILVMTSNAGAQYAHLSNIGYGATAATGTVMLSQVKKTFKPEFINRLTDIVIFNDMDKTMASLILQKKLSLLESKLMKKKVSLTLSKEASDFLLEKGYSKEYGAREMDRVIRALLATPLSKEIIFGSLKKGGHANVILSDGKLTFTKKERINIKETSEIPSES